MRRTPLTTMALACALALAACGGADEIAGGPSSPPSIAATPTPISSTSPSAPAHETPEDFIRRWREAYYAMETTGDTSEFRSLSDSACGSCSAFLKRTERVYSAGGHVEAEPILIRSIRYSKARMYGADTTYYVHETVAPSRYRETANGPWKQLSGGNDTQIYYLVRTNAGWLMREYAQLAGSYSPLTKRAS